MKILFALLQELSIFYFFKFWSMLAVLELSWATHRKSLWTSASAWLISLEPCHAIPITRRVPLFSLLPGFIRALDEHCRSGRHVTDFQGGPARRSNNWWFMSFELTSGPKLIWIQPGCYKMHSSAKSENNRWRATGSSLLASQKAMQIVFSAPLFSRQITMSHEYMLFSNEDLFPIYFTSAKYLANAYQPQ